MVLEIAHFYVKPGMEKAFEEGAAKAAAAFKRAKGCKGMELHRTVEKPNLYRLLVQWETLEDHTEGFRGSDNWKEWRSYVEHCWDGKPEVEHTRQVVRGF
jgi:heme-degrading monooxygenase HmoA